METLVKSKKAKKTVNLKLILGDISPWDNIPTVDSLDNLKPYQVVKTTNYELIKRNPLNRFDQKRVDNFKNLMEKGKFYHKPTIILVDYITYMINDNHHKITALAEKNEPITFMLCDLGEEFRSELSMEHIANLNDSNSAWTSKNKYDQATNAGYSVAATLVGLKKKLQNVEPSNNFRPWNILNFALGKNCESSVKIEDYRNSKINTILNSKSFNKDFKALITIIGTLENFKGGIRPSETLKRLSVLNGKGLINITEFANKFSVHYKRFNPLSKNKNDLDKAIRLILSKKI